MSDKLLTDILHRLNIALSLQINPISDSSSDQEKIERLALFGLTPSEIAAILGSTGIKVSKQLYAIKSKKKGKK